MPLGEFSSANVFGGLGVAGVEGGQPSGLLSSSMRYQFWPKLRHSLPFKF